MSVYPLDLPPDLDLWQIPWLSAHDDKYRNLNDSLVEKHLQIKITKLDLESHQLQFTVTSFTFLMCIHVSGYKQRLQAKPSTGQVTSQPAFWKGSRTS